MLGGLPPRPAGKTRWQTKELCSPPQKLKMRQQLVKPSRTLSGYSFSSPLNSCCRHLHLLNSFAAITPRLACFFRCFSTFVLRHLRHLARECVPLYGLAQPCGRSAKTGLSYRSASDPAHCWYLHGVCSSEALLLNGCAQ